MLEEVEYYIENILKNQLIKIGINNNQIILDSIRKQIYSLIYHWNDINFRNTILLTGLEEGYFYQEQASDLIKGFVVVTIRNSRLETATSDAFKKYSFEKQILDSDIPSITNKAIAYFKKLDLSILASKIKINKEDDYYLLAKEKYEDSFKILEILANINGNEKYFEKLEINKCSNIFFQGINNIENTKSIVYEDGYSEEINVKLMQVIQECNALDKLFFTHSFKYITRNIFKLLRFIQVLLENDMVYVTCNYYISNGYVSRRNKLVRVPHSQNERNISIRNITGLSKKHRKTINDLRRRFIS